ncbi:unnamed protein product [Thlaspi arvense]|uniref:Uncharacterized protein n=1 Tax=Thlaspi arvense TaxID=13288 RepID=A0AAU9RQU5_THLAR|nr:unnamed protein product [Thlaspi arvense]
MKPPCCDKSNVKKGLWTAEEDAKILAYVAIHGVGNWSLIPKKAGLNRCGKSCRLRWTNYLRPDLKHDSFSPQEEELIIQCHKIIGSRWSSIARKLPGRTDNDVKNHWNTKLKKKLMKMGIDPVTHKPVSQVLLEFRNISGHGNPSEAFVRNFKTEPSNNSVLTQSNSAWEMMRNTTSHEGYYNSPMIFNNPASSEFQAAPLFHLSTSNSNHLLNGTASSCSSSSSSASITQPNQAGQAPAATFCWSDYLLSDPVLPQTQVVGSSATSNLTTFAQNENLSSQGECSSQKIGSKGSGTCRSASSFVDEILDKDQEMLSKVETFTAMALVLSSSIVSPLGINIDMNKNLGVSYSSFPKIHVFRICSPLRIRKSVVSSRKNSGTGLASEDKKLLLERYGYDATEFATQSKKTRRKEEERSGRNSQKEEEVVVQPRTTHRLLQVLAGSAKRKKLLSLKGMDVRPMMEVVKGAAFGILQAAGGCPTSLRPGRWLDLYSGTGSVGIEAISRGCSEDLTYSPQAHFVEMDPWVVSNVLQPNLEHTGFVEASVIHTARVENFLERKDGAFDYISVTPPYMEVDYEVLMDQISKSAAIGENTFIVVEYPSRTTMLDSCGCLEKMTDRRFGRTHLAIYGPKWAQKPRKS